MVRSDKAATAHSTQPGQRTVYWSEWQSAGPLKKSKTNLCLELWDTEALSGNLGKIFHVNLY